jgi:3-phenylpropionate/trans-cinnamate dioxygenase ferredoxin reductase subunit
VVDYVIVGAGRAGIAAAEGIRELDGSGSILIVGAEQHLPYDRPPLTKQLWFGKKTVEEIVLHEKDYYEREGIELARSEQVVELRPSERTIVTDLGRSEHYGKLLLATGGVPRRLEIPGAEDEKVVYYRTLDHYLELRHQAEGRSFVVIGGGFIGSEIAAALNLNRAQVTMIFPERYLVERIFPESLGRAVQADYEQRGLRILSEDLPTAFLSEGERMTVETRSGERVSCDAIVVGAGIAPETRLAVQAGLKVGNGIELNELLQSSDPDVYAAGDNAFFPYAALGVSMRIEHWDNALSQGKAAGRNMAGADEPFTYMPYFYSDLFDLGYEAVGDVRSALTTFADWREENQTGVVYYLEDGKVRGALLCNVWEKLDDARELIRSGKRMSEDDLRGAIG